MPRRMSFALTTPQMERKEKTETMRTAWDSLLPGDVVIAVEKAQGLKKGQRQVVIGKIEIVSKSRVRVDSVTSRNCIAEGFPDLSPTEFVEMFCHHMKCRPSSIVNRIVFKHL